MLARLHTLLMTISISLLSFTAANAQKPNTLTAQQKAEGWQLLFNGKDLHGWHSYLEKAPGSAWQVKDGMIFLNKNSKSVYKDFADLVTNDEYENFDFKIEWKMEPCANSGIMFYVHESPEFHNTYESGPEMQIADLACNDDGRILKCRAGDLYDLIPADTEWVRNGGHWNQYEIIADHGHIAFIQNGHKILETQMWDAHWKDMVAHSKFA
ncbi:MAG: DUF1080 domain-containing protein, partial [Bacteroidota bacterium]|nr:DUF1080 domain-containing protein [Bacteroidota bacterium]